MSFYIDQQTFKDLTLLEERGRDSVFGLFKGTHTRGGGIIMEQMFRYPLSDETSINRRSRIIRYFQEQGISFPFREEWFDLAEQYLQNDDERSRLGGDEQKLGRMFNRLVGTDTEYKKITKGITAVIAILETFHHFLETIFPEGELFPYHDEALLIRNILNDEDLLNILRDPDRKSQGYEKKAAQDKILRFQKKNVLLKLFVFGHQLDVYITVARVAASRKFVFPEAVPSGQRNWSVKGIYHPLLAHAVDNDVTITAKDNVIFLTGANMAGKSTFMKSLGIAVFLAHLGFPVPARHMEFPVMEGLFTTINLPDNIGMGYSHFYAEVRRVKKVTGQLSQSKRLFVIFDELFRGTNVKDAYEATVALTSAFAQTRDCVFVISTHIIEAGDELKKLCNNIQFVFLPTRMNGNKPEYTYRLGRGITSDRHGMIIINNEKILEILHRPPKVKAEMPFATDKQTLDDLNLQGKFKKSSIFSLFNSTQTPGGERLLESMFSCPLHTEEAINQRSRIIRFFQEKAFRFPVDQRVLEVTENYILGGSLSGFFAAAVQSVRRKLFSVMGLQQESVLIEEGLKASIIMLKSFRQFVAGILNGAPENPFAGELKKADELFNSKKLSWLNKADPDAAFSFLQIMQYDYFLRSQLQEELNTIFELVYAVDVYIAVAAVAARRGFSPAQAVPAERQLLKIEDGFHPGVEKAVPNTIELNRENNMIFLTGANMAGKSTFMKTFAICSYLAHMGFPVPAKSMVFSVKDGIYTSINVSDNLNMGYSHFYSEVLRVKTIAEEVSSPKNLVVIFDELFKGTNVKDAYDATLAISEALAEHSNCFFIISTHIVEVGDKLLKDKTGGIRFRYMPTEMKENLPTYTYRAREGISSDRHGMMIIRNEKILDFGK